MIFLLGHEIQKELDDVMESHSAEQNLNKFIRSHALIGMETTAWFSHRFHTDEDTGRCNIGNIKDRDKWLINY